MDGVARSRAEWCTRAASIAAAWHRGTARRQRAFQRRRGGKRCLRRSPTRSDSLGRHFAGSGATGGRTALFSSVHGGSANEDDSDVGSAVTCASEAAAAQHGRSTAQHRQRRSSTAHAAALDDGLGDLLGTARRWKRRCARPGAAVGRGSGQPAVARRGSRRGRHSTAARARQRAVSSEAEAGAAASAAWQQGEQHGQRRGDRAHGPNGRKLQAARVLARSYFHFRRCY